MRKIKIFLISAAVSLVVLAPTYAATDDPTEFGGDARLFGMGQAYSAITDDTNAIFLNPAGLGSTKAMELSGMSYHKVFGSYYYLSGAGAVPTEYGTFAVGYVGSGIAGITETNNTSAIGKFGYSDNVMILSYGGSLGRIDGSLRRIFVGGNFKVFDRGFEGSVGDRGHGNNFDLGIKYFHTTWLYFGLAKTNLLSKSMGGGINWTTGLKEDIESTTRLGAAIKTFDGAQLTGVDMKTSSDATKPVLFAVATEYKTGDFLALRICFSENIDAQVRSKLSWNPSFGIGLNYLNFSLDYAYRPYYSDPTNVTNFVSLAFSGNLEDIFKIKVKIAKSNDETSKRGTLYDIPGKTYDDLGDVVRGAEPNYHLGSYGSPHLGNTAPFIPVTAQAIDYDTLMAYAFSDIKYAKEERSPKRYWPGDIVPVFVEAPYDTDNIIAMMPDGNQIKFSYDDKATAWYGIWRVPRGMKGGLFRAKIIATDFEGMKVVSESTPFLIGGIEAQKPAGEGISFEAQKRASEEAAKIEAQRASEDAARAAEEAAKIKARKRAAEDAAMAAEETAKIEAQKRASEEAAKAPKEAVKLTAKRKVVKTVRVIPKKPVEDANVTKVRLIASARSYMIKLEYEKARAELMALLKIDPNNGEVKKMLNRLEAVIKAKKAVQ